MARPYTDAELLEHIRQVFEDEAKLEQHYEEQGWPTQPAQAAVLKLRKQNTNT
jgi:hypothetical protein